MAKVLARPIMAPLVRPITTAVGAIQAAPLVLFDVDIGGIVGRSYVFGIMPQALAPIVDFAQTIDPVPDPVSFYDAMAGKYRLLGRQGALGCALAGVEMALWDARAKGLGITVAEMLGGTPAPVPCYDSHGLIVPDRDEPVLEASLAQGFKAVKIKLGLTEAQDIASVRRVREVIGPDVALMVDYNQSLSAPDAIRRVRALEEYDIAWVEEPVPAEDFAGHIAVRQGVNVPVQTGENWWHPGDAARAIQAGICDLAMPDLMRIGGITGWQRAAAICAGASVPVSSHLYIEATAHVMPVTPGAHWLEYLDLAGAVLRDPYAISDGCLTARGAGLGLEWDEAAVARYAV